VDKDGKAQTRPVEVGDWQGDNWFIFKGLSAGDRVITDGLIRLATGVPVKVVAGSGVPPESAPTGQD
jgi:membrane fusion protein (multidrug efflux system)